VYSVYFFLSNCLALASTELDAAYLAKSSRFVDRRQMLTYVFSEWRSVRCQGPSLSL